MSWNMINTPDPEAVITLKCVKGTTPRASNSYIKCGLKEVRVSVCKFYIT